MDKEIEREKKLEELRREINLGLKDVEEGRVITGNEVFRDLEERVKAPGVAELNIENIIVEARAIYAKRKQAKNK